MLRAIFSRTIPSIGAALSSAFHSCPRIGSPGFSLFNPILSRNQIMSPLRNNKALEQPSRHMANHRHKKYIKLAKGYFGRANRCYKVARMRVEKGRQYAYRDRKVRGDWGAFVMYSIQLTYLLLHQVRRRDFRKLWIQRINAGSRMYGVTYNSFTCHLLRSGIGLNRKILSQLAFSEPLSFKAVVDVVKQAKM